MEIDMEQRRRVEAKLNEMMDDIPAWVQPPLTNASRKTAEELLTSAEYAALRLVAYNRQSCAWIRGDLYETGDAVEAPPQAEILTCASRISLNLRMASIIARGELEIEIAQRLDEMADSIQPTIFPLTIRPEPIQEAREALSEALRCRAERLERFDDDEEARHAVA